MTFVSTPNSGQSLGGTRDQIRTNMDDLRTNDAVNHYDTNDALRGKHKFMQMPVQASDAATSATELALYTKNDGSSNPRLYLREPSSGTVRQFSGPQSAASSGYCFLPGGFLLQWGSGAAANPGTVTFPVAFTTAYQVVGTTNANDRTFSVTAITNSNFTQSVLNPAGVTIRWFAIGLA